MEENKYDFDNCLELEKIRTNQGYAGSGLRHYKPTKDEDLELKELSWAFFQKLCYVMLCHRSAFKQTSACKGSVENVKFHSDQHISQTSIKYCILLISILCYEKCFAIKISICLASSFCNSGDFINVNSCCK